jgi:DNA mismatch repair protein MutS2
MPEEIIDKSIQYLGRQGQMLDELVTSLEIGKKRVEEEREAILRAREELKRRLSLLNEKREEMLTRFEERVSKRLMEIEIEIEEIRKEVSKKERVAIKRGKERLRALEEKVIKTTRRQKEAINVGDYVNIRSLNSHGQVIGISADGDMVEVMIGDMKTRANRLFVEKARNTPASISAMNRDRIDIEPLEGPELNIMGMRVDDAMKEVDRFIDKAIIEGISRVRILHGIGTGRLMNAVKEHLTEAAYIKEIKIDARNKGVTIVELA